MHLTSFRNTPRTNADLSSKQTRQPIAGVYYNVIPQNPGDYYSMFATRDNHYLDKDAWKEDFPLYISPGSDCAFFNVDDLKPSITYGTIRFLGYAANSFSECVKMEQTSFYRGYKSVRLMVKGTIKLGDILVFSDVITNLQVTEHANQCKTYVIMAYSNAFPMYRKLLAYTGLQTKNTNLTESLHDENKGIRPNNYTLQKKIKLGIWNLMVRILSDGIGVIDASDKPALTTAVTLLGDKKCVQIFDKLDSYDGLDELFKLKQLIDELVETKKIGIAQSSVNQKKDTTSLQSVWVLH